MPGTVQRTEEIVREDFILRVTEDKMQVLLSCEPEVAASEGFAGKLQEKLDQAGIKVEMDGKRLKKIIDLAVKEKRAVIDVPIVKGKPPVQPEDGRLEWTGDYFSEGYYVDPDTGIIDYKEKVGAPAVEEGQLLVKVFPPVPGEDGIDIYGKRISVPKPKPAKIRPGPNAIKDDEQGGLVAKCPGRVKLNGDVLDVENVYNISGDVGNETGNIKHNGQVIIQGDIEANFKVDVQGDVEVRGIIYACDLKCTGNLTAHEGINQDPEKKVIVKGDIVAKYINNASIECESLVVAKNEIFQSNIKTSGEVNCSDGRILGGEVVAARGIVAGEVGSKSNAATSLTVGVDYRKLEKAKENKETISAIKDAMKKLETGKKQLLQNVIQMTAKHKEVLTEIDYKFNELQGQLTELEEENKEIASVLKSCRDAKIKILKMVYPGVVLRISNAKYTVNTALAGPLEASLEKSSGKVVLTS
ncbi:MAG: DUF342 domain-containing protein [candidate division Zixibacteria bacterium]|nr:DUF342 domain-containing protein [candidate division Zixibacteria bacterium]